MKADAADLRMVVERQRGLVIARFPQEMVLSGTRAEAAGKQLMDLLGESDGRLLVDFGNVQGLTSLMIGELVKVSRAARAPGKKFALFNLRDDVREILTITGLRDTLGLYGNEQEALQGTEPA